MTNSNKLRILHVALALSVLSGATLNAGQVTTFTWYPGVASLASTFIDPAPTPNDNVSGPSSYEIYVTQKDYHAIGPVDITFDVVNNGGTTEYRVREGVQNATGVPWGSYHIELGYNVGALFTKSLPGDGLDFDSPDFDSPNQFDPAPGFYFPTVVNTGEDIFASGGVMPSPGFAGYFRFNIDVPDGITQFTLRQSPVALGVPEPCGVALVAIGVGGLALRRRRRHA
jgi:hypothetical protein